MMTKEIIRSGIAFSVATPFALLFHLSCRFADKQKIIGYLGPLMTFFAKNIQQFFPPKIKNASEFDKFGVRARGRQKIWKLLYDYPIDQPDENTVRIIIRQCPFAEALNRLGISELGIHMCRGDWELAKANAGKWEFQREHQIGAGDAFCDFTYKRIRKN